ncbi:MAG TPA: hypothetical protein VMT73_06345 [Anaerolineales bacterium]|nr:hypothetical protein [Anaerolineales bacterium]
MNKYDYGLDAPQKNSGASRLELWDMLSILVLLITVCAGAYFLLIFLSPNSPLNPLPPNNPIAPPTFTITPLSLEPTWTASPTIEPTITDTPRPTFTPLPSPTGFSLVPPTNTPVPTATPKAPFSGTWNPIQSTIIHPEAACNWFGVGGTVVDTNNSDVIGMVVRLVGTLNGNRIEMTQVSGVTPAYGKSGFEFFLGTTPFASSGTLYVQLLDLAGLPLSDNVYIDTYTDCKKNLILVRFKKNR